MCGGCEGFLGVGITAELRLLYALCASVVLILGDSKHDVRIFVCGRGQEIAPEWMDDYEFL